MLFRSTHDNDHLYISDVTNIIYMVEPETLNIIGRIDVHTADSKVDNINELEYVDGYIYANKWTTEYILKINAKTGLLEGYYKLNGLLKESDYTPERTDVLNGIAYNKQNKSFFITGKRWPKMFEMMLK